MTSYPSRTTPSQVFDTLAEIYEGRAGRPYGLSGVHQRLHAVQSGVLARAQGGTASFVVAALLHDIGHMVHELGEHPAAAGIDDRHEAIGAHWLAQHFGADVVEPVRLHVAAKRYLCATEPDYFSRLSSDSVESLALQGGPMNRDEQDRFEQLPSWRHAVALRRIDEVAKDPAGPCPPFSAFEADIIAALMAR
jgi:predicted HD phosphohydrolase